MRSRALPEKKRAYHHGDLARALVAAAVALLDKHGPDALTLREVAASVGVTHAAAYRHFEDKNALLAAIAEEGFRDLAKTVEQAVTRAPAADPLERMRAFADAYIGFAWDRRAQYGVMFGPRLNEDGRFPSLEEAIAAVVAIGAKEIHAGQERGVIRPGRTRDIGMSIWVFAHGYAELVHRRRVKVKNRAVALEYFQLLFDPVLRGLRP
jgi:AcrR family transcriptional regulator